MISNRNKEIILLAYGECETEEEREETVKDMAAYVHTSTMEIRQLLQAEKAYKSVEATKSPKEQMANALEAVTQVESKEWMKLSIAGQNKMWNFILEMSKKETETNA